MSLTSISPAGSPTYYPSLNAGEAAASTPSRNDGVATEKAQAQNQDRVASNDEPTETYGPDGKLNKNAQEPEAAGTEEQDTSENQASEAMSDSEESGYTPEEEKEIQELKDRDKEVKAHEQAHIAAAGRYARSGASFEYQTGPDGKRYAVGGEVSIDVSKESKDPQATVAKMQTVIRAALAPAEPSAQDRSVAARAARTVMEARAEAVETAQENPDDNARSSQAQKTRSEPYTDTMDASSGTSAIDIYS